MVEFYLNDLILPVNPSEYSKAREGSNELADILSLGQVVIPGGTKLATMTIESFFTITETASPMDAVYAIDEMWLSKQPVRFVITELNQQDMLVLIQNFDYTIKATEEGDVYFKLDLIEYKPYGAQTVPIAEDIARPLSPQRTEENKPPVNREYTVKSGDSLWAISQQLNGDPNAWRELYQANKTVIGNNPDRIHTNTVLSIPESWVTA